MYYVCQGGALTQTQYKEKNVGYHLDKDHIRQRSFLMSKLIISKVYVFQPSVVGQTGTEPGKAVLQDK